jgi:hypothetical protein
LDRKYCVFISFKVKLWFESVYIIGYVFTFEVQYSSIT